MEIRIGSLLRGAQEAEGTVIVIDVFRAFTTGAVAFSRGAEKIILVAEVAEALELKSQSVGEICIGEVGGIRPEFNPVLPASLGDNTCLMTNSPVSPQLNSRAM